jgi:hypothetical protein
VNLPADLQRLLPILAVGVVALAAAVFVTRGLGGDSSASAQQVLDRAIKEEPKSGALNVRFTFSVGTRGEDTTAVDTVISGEGADTAPGKPPKERFRHTERVNGRAPVSYDELSTGEQGFIRVDRQWYQLSPDQYKRVFAPDTGEENLVQALGFDPRQWMRDPELGSTNARVGGVEANHVHGAVDAETVFNDLGVYSGVNPNNARAQRFTEILRGSSKSGSMDLFAGKEDGIIRKLSVTTTADASNNTPPIRATLTFAFGLDKVNEPVQVRAPQGALPSARIADIPRAKLGDSADEVFGPSKVASKQGSAAKQPKRDGAAQSAPQRKERPSAQAYLSCVQSAADLATLERCQKLLP